MKKRLFNYFFLAAFIAMTTLVLASCGDDEGNETIQAENAGGNNTGKADGNKGTSEFIEPCLDWGCNADHIKKYMSNSWKLDDTSSDHIALIYISEDGSVEMLYSFVSNRTLTMVDVYYNNQPETKLTSFVEEVEKRYNCKMTKAEGEDLVYTAKTTINGRTAAIIVRYIQNNIIGVLYGLPESD